MSPTQDVHVLIPRTWEYDLAGVVKLRQWRWGDFSGLSRWAQYYHKSLYEIEEGGFRLEET